ncbi:MAG: S41 family peptidase [Paludibacter sp.]|jgi:carboxyl-terminal processing protease|nr:S41 family peptidase [Paludibacter sp.]
MKKNILLVAIIFVSTLVGLLLGNILAARNFNDNTQTIINFVKAGKGGGGQVGELLSLINRHYVDTVAVEKLTEEMLVDLVAKLDPHSVYIPPADLKMVNEDLEGSFSGIGVQFNIQNDTVMVIQVISGGPSEKVGIQAGDRIVLVNDSIFTGKSINNEKVQKKLKGPANTKVKLGIKRFGTDETLTYSVTRGKIPLKSVDIAYIIAPETGFIKVNAFAANTYNEFLNAIANLKSKGAKKFIIDLRENGGGLMEVAIAMVNEFLPANRMIVYADGKAYRHFEQRADGNGSCIGAEVAVLIDQFSASASEIFSGALQDNDCGTIIGRRSFGKGLVQQQFNLSNGGAVRITVARYYTPSGRSIQKPYTIGDAEGYEKDIFNRFLHGEFDSADSIQMTDTLKYKTLKGRTVYGGGGIMPDIFVPRDTSGYSNYYVKVVNYRYPYQFAFRYSDANRNELSKFKEWKQLDKYLTDKNLISEFIKFTSEKGVKPVTKDIETSRSEILLQLKAYITRNILGDNGFYPLLYQKDATVQTAIDALKN